ncbi:hypothetical protein PanWU01x14_307250, partial [Parasponia andersonii]
YNLKFNVSKFSKNGLIEALNYWKPKISNNSFNLLINENISINNCNQYLIKSLSNFSNHLIFNIFQLSNHNMNNKSTMKKDNIQSTCGIIRNYLPNLFNN